jgi:hypothetical protein
MIDAQKFMRWKDALDENNRILSQVIAEARHINSQYQEYLKENPYKRRRKELQLKKEKTILRIIELTKQGHENYDGK